MMTLIGEGRERHFVKLTSEGFGILPTFGPQDQCAFIPMGRDCVSGKRCPIGPSVLGKLVTS